jgi:hypothetical protein
MIGGTLMKLDNVSNVLFCLNNDKIVHYKIRADKPNGYKWSELTVNDFYLLIDLNVYEYYIDSPILFWTNDCRRRYSAFMTGNDEDFKIMMADPTGDCDLLFDKMDKDAFTGFVKLVEGERYWIKMAYDNSWIGVWDYEEIEG